MRYHMSPMRRNRALVVTRRQPNWLLVCAMLALSVHALANMGLMPARGLSSGAAAGDFFAEVCTGKGMVKVGASSLRSALTDAIGHESDCCELCSLGNGPAVAASDPADALAVTWEAQWPSGLSNTAAQSDWLLQAPRGPPPLA